MNLLLVYLHVLYVFFASAANQEMLSWKFLHVGEILSWL